MNLSGTVRNTGLLILAAFLSSASFAADVPRTIAIKGNDLMRFSVTRIEAKPGESLRITLTATGAMPKGEMAHNFVLLDPAVKLNDFITMSAIARGSGFIAPAFQKQVLAATGLAGAGETVEVTFNAPKTPGTYRFVCTFPGHFNGGMEGQLIVK